VLDRKGDEGVGFRFGEPFAEVAVMAEKIFRLWLRGRFGPGGHSGRVAGRASKYDRHGYSSPFSALA
jgi:hypothetical protein